MDRLEKIKQTELWWRDRSAISMSLKSSEFAYLPAYTVALVPSHISSEPLQTDEEVEAILDQVDWIRLQKTPGYFKLSRSYFYSLPKTE